MSVTLSTTSLSTGQHAGRSDSIAGIVGATPVLWIDAGSLDPGGEHAGASGFWAKLEGCNPGGIKDRAALYMVRRARERGVLAPGEPIVESSSGTFGIALALAGVVHGHPVTVVTDPGLDPFMDRLLRTFGVRVDTVSEPDRVGGWQRARCDRVAEILDAEPGAWRPDQYNNPDNVAAYTGLGAELVGQLGRVDVLVASVGTGGHSAGVARVLRRHFPGLKVVGVDTVGSVIFGQPDRPRIMRGLGNSLYPSNVDYGAFDEVHWVAPGEAVWTSRKLARAHFATGGWSVGAVGLVAGWLARTSPPGTRVAAIFPDGPHRYLETVFDDAFCRANGLLGAPPREPDEIGHPAEREVRTWTRCTTVVDPRGGTG